MIVALWALFGASPAQAATLASVSSNPADGSTLVSSPASITVTFNQQIGQTNSMVIVCNTNPVATGSAFPSADRLSLVLDLSVTPLPKGSCVVQWKVQGTSEPGTTPGSFAFTIQEDTLATAASVASGSIVAGDASATTAATVADAAETSESTDLGGPLGLARLISTLAIAAIFGALVLITVAWPEGVEYILTIRYLRLAWLVALISTVVTITCLTAQFTGKGFTPSLSPTSWLELRDASTPGLAALARVALVVATGWVAFRPEKVIDPTTQLPALALPALAVATLGFSRSGGSLEIVGYAAGVGHALAMALWIGGLMLLGRVVLVGPGEDDLVHAVRGFGRLATPAMLITVLTGAVQLYRLDRGHLLNTTHGKLLLFKVVPVVAMVFVGVATRQFVRARLGRADAMTTPLASRLRRAVGMEALIGVLVLSITSWMLSTVPGNLIAGPRTSSNFEYQYRFALPDEALDVKLSLDPAKVGANEMFVEIRKPTIGIISTAIQFAPPATSGASPVLMTIPGTLLGGTGVAHLDQEIGLPLGASGVWTVTITITTATGSLSQQGTMTVAADGSAARDLPISTPTLPPVTSPPNAGTTTTVVAG